MSTPQSTIYVCSGVRLDFRYNHTIYFESETLQRAWFMSKVVKQFSTYSFIRKSWNLKLQATMEQAKTWNYLFFHNSDDSKMYYYFINNIEYINDATVELTLELDVMQTYMFDYALLPCFVERQHSESDEIGEHTLDEGLELGTLYINDSVEVDLSDLYIMVLSSTDLVEAHDVSHSIYDGVYSGLRLYATDASDDNAVKALDAAIKNPNITDGIVAVWMYPKRLVTLKWDDLYICEVEEIFNFNVNAEMNTELGGYPARNKKLLSYPYNFLYTTNNHGGSGVYRYEKFADGIHNFRVTGALSPEGSCMLIPLNYNGETLNYEEGITLGGFPNCSWVGDTYKLWLAQNQNQQNFAIGTAAISAGAGLAVAAMTGGVGAALGVSSFMSAGQQIGAIIAQRKDMEVQPNQARGNQSGSIGIVNEKQTFSIQKKSITAEYAAILDEYFDLYGYKLNRVMKPKPLTRTFYTYTKTVGCQIAGFPGMCTEDKVKIESIFDKGITFWANGDILGDYVACREANLPR